MQSSISVGGRENAHPIHLPERPECVLAVKRFYCYDYCYCHAIGAERANRTVSLNSIQLILNFRATGQGRGFFFLFYQFILSPFFAKFQPVKRFRSNKDSNFMAPRCSRSNGFDPPRGGQLNGLSQQYRKVLSTCSAITVS